MGLAALGLAPPAAAQEGKDRVHLSWVRDAPAAEACASAAAIQADVSERLGFSPFVAAEPNAVAIEVLVSGNAGGWSASIAMRDADGSVRGSRRVESRAVDCQSLVSATSLAIALMIDPQLLLREPTEHPPEPKLPVEAPGSPPRDVVVAADPSPPSVMGGAVRAGLSVAAGLLPDPSVGPVLEGEIGVSSRWSISVTARFFPETRWSRAGANVSSSLVLGSTGPCHRVELSAHWALSSCAAVLVGSFGLVVSSPEPVEPGARAWLGAAVGLRLARELGPLEIGLELEGVVHVPRRQYEVQLQNPSRREVLFRESPVAGLGTLTVGVRH